MDSTSPLVYSDCSKKRVAIIGAGCSGLTAIKSCLDEGLEPICFEKSNTIGGLWNYSDTVKPENGSIYKSLVINTSKNMMMFSDFPPPESFPPFLTHVKVMEYFKLYAEHFQLYSYVNFNTEVLNISKTDNYDKTGKWRVRYSKQRNSIINCDDVTEEEPGDEICEDIFEGVMICTGHHSVPYLPKIDGLALFKGQILHSHSYKSPEVFQDKKVVIVGFGNSAADIACDLAKTAKQVYLSSRRGAWIVPRTAFWGLPADMLANSRLVFTMPYALLDWCVQKQANFRVDHQTYGLKPDHGVLNCHPSINDELPIHLVNGRVQIKANVKQVNRDGVLLDDDSFLDCDVIILATGYDYRLDFVSPEVIKIENNCTELYQYVFPPHLQHPTLGVIGLIQAIGAVMPISEIQSRWFARLMTGDVNLPSTDTMLNDIRVKKSNMDALYLKSRRHTLQTFWIEYMDTIASRIDARPNLLKMMLNDPELALKCYFGPCFPAQYRLTGPGRWSGARQFIVTAMSRAFRPKHVRKNESDDNRDETTQTSKTWLRHVNDIIPGEQHCTHCRQHHQHHNNDDYSTCVSRRQTNNTSGNDSEAYCTITTIPVFDSNSDELVYGVNQNQNKNHNRHSSSSVCNPACSNQRRWYPEWMTMTFYATLLFFCFLTWAIAIFIDKTENVLWVLEKTVGRYLPLGD